MRTTAAVAALCVLLAGAGVGTYCIVFRTTPVQLQSPGLEEGIVAGAIVLLALIAHLAVISGARRAGGGTGAEAEIERLLERALEIDATDPEAVREFQSVPPLRDLVASWIGERTQVRELGDRVEELRGELNGLSAAMRRNPKSPERIVEQSTSPFGVQIVSSWNALVERVERAEAQAQAAASAQKAASAAAPAVAKDPGVDDRVVRTLVARLDELETELDRLRGRVQETPVRDDFATGIGTAPRKLAPPAPEPADEFALPPASQDTSSRAFDADDDAFVLPPTSKAEVTPPAPDTNPTPPPAAAAPPARRMLTGDDEWSEVEVVDPLPRTRSWQIVSGDAPKLFTPEPENERTPPPPLPTLPASHRPHTAPPAAPPRSAHPAAPPAAPPGDPRFEDLDFPHFVGKPVHDLDDRVAVTYEGHDAAAENAELPANMLLFDDDDLQATDEPPLFDFDSISTPERER